MSTRQKLAREFIALRFHNMRLKYGQIVRDRTTFTAQQFTDTCIDCGGRVGRTDLIVRAYWQNRQVNGFYAHVTCEPLKSEWLRNVDFPVIIGEGSFRDQRCRPHNEQVTARVLSDDLVRYVCPKCIEENRIR